MFRTFAFIATVSALFVSISVNSHARADTCDASIKRYNDFTSETTRWKNYAIRQDVGINITDLRMDVDTCPKLLPILKEYNERLQQAIQLRSAVQKSCSGSGTHNVGSGTNPAEATAANAKYIAYCTQVVQGTAPQCEPGWVAMREPKKCMPIAATDCGGGKFCTYGYVCNASTNRCDDGPEIKARQRAEQQKEYRETRRAEDKRRSASNGPSGHGYCTHTLLAPGAWAFETKCLGGGPGKKDDGAPNRDWIRQSVNELAQHLNGGAPADQLPPSSTVIASAPNPPPRQSSGASGAPPVPGQTEQPGTGACVGTNLPSYCYGQDYSAYCAYAKDHPIEQGTAYYGYVCVPDASNAAADSTGQPGANLTTPRTKAPPRFRGRLAPDVRRDILALAGSIMDMPDSEPDRPKRVRKFKRLLADHGVPVTPQDIVCLQPISGSPPLIDVPLRWHPQHIKKEAIEQSHLCDDVPVGDAKEACRESKYGQAVMWAEPELAGQCRTANAPDFNIDAVAECAKRKFLNAWATNEGIVSAPVPDNWVMPAGCGATASPATRKNTLRDRLLASLAGPDNKNNSQAQRPAAGAPVAASSDPPPPPPTPPAIDDDEAYCNYMAREVVRGELIPSTGTAIPPGCRATIAAALALRAKQQTEDVRPFSMNADETDREIAKLLGPTVNPTSPTVRRPAVKKD
jgi:hypothetical protein